MVYLEEWGIYVSRLPSGIICSRGVSDKSAVQNIDAICFTNTGILKDEFSRLYPALFAEAENHISIIRALEELEQSGFISVYHAFGKKKKDKLYRLTDEYSLFYLQFIEDKLHEGDGTWQTLRHGA